MSDNAPANPEVVGQQPAPQQQAPPQQPAGVADPPAAAADGVPVEEAEQDEAMAGELLEAVTNEIGLVKALIVTWNANYTAINNDTKKVTDLVGQIYSIANEMDQVRQCYKDVGTLAKGVEDYLVANKDTLEKIKTRLGVVTTKMDLIKRPDVHAQAESDLSLITNEANLMERSNAMDAQTAAIANAKKDALSNYATRLVKLAGIAEESAKAWRAHIDTQRELFDEETKEFVAAHDTINAADTYKPQAEMLWAQMAVHIAKIREAVTQAKFDQSDGIVPRLKEIDQTRAELVALGYDPALTDVSAIQGRAQATNAQAIELVNQMVLMLKDLEDELKKARMAVDNKEGPPAPAPAAPAPHEPYVLRTAATESGQYYWISPKPLALADTPKPKTVLTVDCKIYITSRGEDNPSLMGHDLKPVWLVGTDAFPEGLWILTSLSKLRAPKFLKAHVGRATPRRRLPGTDARDDQLVYFVPTVGAQNYWIMAYSGTTQRIDIPSGGSRSAVQNWTYGNADNQDRFVYVNRPSGGIPFWASVSNVGDWHKEYAPGLPGEKPSDFASVLRVHASLPVVVHKQYTDKLIAMYRTTKLLDTTLEWYMSVLTEFPVHHPGKAQHPRKGLIWHPYWSTWFKHTDNADAIDSLDGPLSPEWVPANKDQREHTYLDLVEKKVYDLETNKVVPPDEFVDAIAEPAPPPKGPADPAPSSIHSPPPPPPPKEDPFAAELRVVKKGTDDLVKDPGTVISDKYNTTIEEAGLEKLHETIKAGMFSASDSSLDKRCTHSMASKIREAKKQGLGDLLRLPKFWPILPHSNNGTLPIHPV